MSGLPTEWDEIDPEERVMQMRWTDDGYKTSDDDEDHCDGQQHLQ